MSKEVIKKVIVRKKIEYHSIPEDAILMDVKDFYYKVIKGYIHPDEGFAYMVYDDKMTNIDAFDDEGVDRFRLIKQPNKIAFIKTN